MKFFYTILVSFLLIGTSFAKDISSIKLKDADGKSFALKDNLAKDANLVLFWATWCLPCQKEFPEIAKIRAKFPDKDIKIFAISKDSPRSMAKVKSFIRKHDYDFVWLMDGDGAVSSNFMVDAIPHSLLADNSGTVVYSHTGYRKGDELELEKALAKLWQD
jgi:peroxiredoxin